ncbi:MAG TPA: hypothetical protein VD963_02295, partial [Phycisphaerales bacterium]|nr:hypothetical protein [Phycisphaerales bacterium]
LPEEKISACMERAKVGGGEIVKLMGTSAWYAPSAGTVQMVEAIIRDKKRIIPCAAYCESQYNVLDAREPGGGAGGKGYFVGVPVVLGARGVERIVEVKLSEQERPLMDESIRHVKELVGVVRRMFPELA